MEAGKLVSKNTSIIIQVTEKFNDSLNRMIANSGIISELKKQGYSIDKSVLGRFGNLLVCQNLQLLAKNPDLLLASQKIEASEKVLLSIEKELKKK